MKVKIYSLLAEGGNAYWGYTINCDMDDNVLMVDADLLGSGNSHLTWYPPLAHMYEPSHRESISSRPAKAQELISEIRGENPSLQLTTRESENNSWQVHPLAV